MKTFVINLDRRTDRLNHTSLTLGFHGVEFERVSAIDYKDFVSLDSEGKEYVDPDKVKDGKILDLLEKKCFCASTPQEQLMMLNSYDFDKDLVNMSLSEACVAQSHRKAWNLAKNYDYSLILEDDVTFFTYLKPILDFLQDNNRGFDFDIFLLGWGNKNNFLKNETTNIKFEPHSSTLYRINSALYLQAYIITGAMAAKLAQSIIIGPVDEYLSTLYPSINCYGIDISNQTEGAGDNQHSSFMQDSLLI